jgi:hypothetical protein
MLKRLPSLGTWDVPFSYFLRKKGMLSVVSGRNLVVNLGVGDDATNTKKGLLGAFNIHQSKSEFSGPEEAPASYRKSVEQKMWQKRLRVAILSEAKIVLSSLSRSGKQ